MENLFSPVQNITSNYLTDYGLLSYKLWLQTQSLRDKSKSKFKFSVEDILSPDFGRNACEKDCQKTTQNSTAGRACQSPTPCPQKKRSPSPDSTTSSNLPAWVFCTRYSDRPSAGPRSRKKSTKSSVTTTSIPEQNKRPRTAFNRDQIDRLTKEFDTNKYLSEERRKRLSEELDLSEPQIKVWFQNKRAKVKKTTSHNAPLKDELIRSGLYDHSTITS